ncbi:NAD-dependent epimerase [Paenibacillus sp. IHB B 3415]|uniref:NAD-dependent epimerase/dehydratase family protein n=1 Tax=Paenibacillus sp. IHB B 3415 TaxID=867080 RepID=UPI0005750A6C|nr:NAD-dependent epimerase/dehydratase family protein [Paenibacillus sp. IHB B 3415]KHL95998.1 NAD-dependent epimerase [Paenibacillus sp. IHB B 3415]
MNTNDSKKILITGLNSYIGSSFKKWVEKHKESNSFIVDTVDMKDANWTKKDLSGYDVVYHVAGIAHIKETKKNAPLYSTVNRDLTIELAHKAKNSGVKQFIFLSSMSVYGLERGNISGDTVPNPQTNYGISKLQAEEHIKKLQDYKFKVAIVRPPMVYGQNCKGNYTRLSKLTLKLPVFPNVKNRRSMIYIDNLSEFIRILINDDAKGIFTPQNKEYVSTSEMVRMIADVHGKKVRFIKFFRPIFDFLIRKSGTLNKIFGDLIYDINISDHNREYCVVSLKESIKRAEGYEE